MCSPLFSIEVCDKLDNHTPSKIYPQLNGGRSAKRYPDRSTVKNKLIT